MFENLLIQEKRGPGGCEDLESRVEDLELKLEAIEAILSQAFPPPRKSTFFSSLWWFPWINKTP